jgi:WD40 repeat protein
MHGDSESLVRFVSSVQDGAYIVLGADDGSIRIHQGSDFSRSYSLPVHDNNDGSVTHVACTYDASHVLSIGKDGNFFVFAAAFSGEALPVSCFGY